MPNKIATPHRNPNHAQLVVRPSVLLPSSRRRWRVESGRQATPRRCSRLYITSTLQQRQRQHARALGAAHGVGVGARARTRYVPCLLSGRVGGLGRSWGRARGLRGASGGEAGGTREGPRLSCSSADAVVSAQQQARPRCHPWLPVLSAARQFVSDSAPCARAQSLPVLARIRMAIMKVEMHMGRGWIPEDTSTAVRRSVAIFYMPARGPPVQSTPTFGALWARESTSCACTKGGVQAGIRIR